jgi:hypothetical protein
MIDTEPGSKEESRMVAFFSTAVSEGYSLYSIKSMSTNGSAPGMKPR